MIQIEMAIGVSSGARQAHAFPNTDVVVFVAEIRVGVLSAARETVDTRNLRGASQRGQNAEIGQIYLRRRPIRTCLSILGVGLAVGSALALIALSRSIKDSTQEGMSEMGDDLVVMQKGASDIFGGFIPEQMVARIAAIPGVVRASGELFMFAPGAGDRSVLTEGWPDTSYLWKKVPLREGRVPSPGERHVAVLGEAAAASLGKKLGDELELLGQAFRVIGIANYTTIVNRGIVLVPLIDLQEASYRVHS